MVRTNYERGTEVERKIEEHFKNKGYHAQRSAGSHSLVDVFVWNNQEIFFIQSKRCKSKIGSSIYKDLEKFKNLECPPYVQKEFWVWVDYKGFTILWKSY